jgi:hypothetical protein
MGSSVRNIECKNCGSNYGSIEDDYKECIIITDCIDCNYEKIESYEPEWYKEKGVFSPPLTLISETKT